MGIFTPEEELSRQKNLELFKKNIFLIVANEERILADERFGEVRILTRFGNPYAGTAYSFTLKEFLTLWRTCPKAVYFDDNDRMSFVYTCSGGFTGGWCGFVSEDGTDPVEEKDIEDKAERPHSGLARSFYSSVYSTVHKICSSRGKMTSSMDSYELEDAIEILKRETDPETYARNIEKFKQHILKSRG